VISSFAGYSGGSTRPLDNDTLVSKHDNAILHGQAAAGAKRIVTASTMDFDSGARTNSGTVRHNQSPLMASKGAIVAA
jgi:hypothetical protein